MPLYVDFTVEIVPTYPAPTEVGEERFYLPRWIRRDGPNAPFLQALWAGLQAVQPENALAMLRLAEASGPWLDLHAGMYGLRRELAEPDDSLRARVLAEVQNPRSTQGALQSALQTALGTPVTVWDLTNPVPYEQSILLYDGSIDYDGSRTYGSDTPFGAFNNPFGVFVVDIHGDEGLARKARPIVDRLRAAGMIPLIRYSPSGTPPFVALTP